MPKRPSCQSAQAPLLHAPPIRLLLLPDAADPDGTPRPALPLPNLRPGARPLLRAFPRVAAALATKRTMEAAQ
jgi:hypothetical protein